MTSSTDDVGKNVRGGAWAITCLCFAALLLVYPMVYVSSSSIGGEVAADVSERLESAA
jgi:hypothetical protein